MATLAQYTTHTNPGESIYRDIGGNKYDGGAMSFTLTPSTPHTVDSMMAELKKTGSPSVALRFRIFSDVAGAPGVELGGTTVAAASVTSGYTEITSGAPSTTVTLLPGVTYWLVIDTATQGTDDTNYFQWGMGNTSLLYPSSLYKYNGVFLTETGWNLYFRVSGTEAPVGPANVKTVDQLAKASVKTVAGLAMGSIKTIDGLA